VITKNVRIIVITAPPSLYFANNGVYTPMLSPPFEKVTAATIRKDQYERFVGSVICSGTASPVFRRINLIIPMAIGMKPINPIIYRGMTVAIIDPTALMAIRTLDTVRTQHHERENDDRRKKSSK